MQNFTKEMRSMKKEN